MKRLFLALFTLTLSVGFAAEEAEARRFGGARSFGIQRTAPAPKAAPSAPRQSPATTTAPRRGWMGPIAGLAAGLGLAALFSSLGLGEEMASLFLIGLMAFAAIMLFRRITRASTHAVPAGAGGAIPMPDAAAPVPAPAFTGGARADFDEAGFLRQAKLNFVRLQAAYDIGNLDDIRTFTSPEVFAEVRMQYDERAGAPQQTDVLDLGAELVELTEEAGRYIVSVHFSGLIRESKDAPPAHFSEVWHLTKPVSGEGGWLVSGIQQSH